MTTVTVVPSSPASAQGYDTRKPTAAEVFDAQVDYFTGGGGDMHRHTFGMLYTEGAHFLAESCGAYWLLDVIASYQPSPLIQRNSALRDFQLWTVRKLPVGAPYTSEDGDECNAGDSAAIVECWEDTDRLAFYQIIPWTDFPLDAVRLYVENGVILLPSEH